jgi:hypothetical protein
MVVAPCNNYMGHGFYQLSPELFFRVRIPENGFSIESTLLFFNMPGTRYYQVCDPATVRLRVTLRNAQESLLFCLARRLKAPITPKMHIQQYDYKEIQWKRHSSIHVREARVASRYRSISSIVTLHLSAEVYLADSANHHA